MILHRDNRAELRWQISDGEVLHRFVKSEFYKDDTRDIEVRLALFISADEPRGLQSTYSLRAFNELFELYCINKHKLN
jgi:hypothetical protein